MRNKSTEIPIFSKLLFIVLLKSYISHINVRKLWKIIIVILCYIQLKIPRGKFYIMKAAILKEKVKIET